MRLFVKLRRVPHAWKAAKDIQIYDAIEWLHLAWTGVDPDNIQCCFNKAGFQHVFNKPITDVPEPDLEADVTDDMQSLLDIPFTEFINLESDEMIHPQAAPTISQEQAPKDDDEVLDDYQPDSDCTPTPKFSLDEHLIHLNSLQEKAIQWNDEHMMQMIAELKGCVIENSMKDYNNRKQTTIKEYLCSTNLQ